MVRTQIQLSEDQAAELRRLAAEHRVSMAELVRRGVETYLSREATQGPRASRERAAAVAGRFGSGRGDLAENHDQPLAEAFES